MENNSHPLVSQLVPLQKNLPERKVHLSSKKLTSLEQNSKKKKKDSVQHLTIIGNTRTDTLVTWLFGNLIWGATV